jgi:sugar-specific transcriptional regulator TrmB
MQELLNKILTKNESIVYNDLLHNGVSKATNISKRTKIARNKVYEALYRLEAQKLIVSENTKIKTYGVNSPQKIVDIANKNFLEQKKLSEELQKMMPQMQMLINAKAPQPYFTYIRGIKNIVNEIRSELKPSRKFIYVFARKMTFWEEHKITAPYRQLVKKGVDVRIITADNPTARAIVKKIGAKAIFIPQELVVKKAMVINDALFSISLYGEHEGLMMLTDSQELVEAFKSLFLMIWTIAEKKK